MSKQREALQMALDALIEVTGWQWAGPMRVMDEVEDAIAAIREALSEPEQEPVAWLDPWTQRSVTRDFDTYGIYGIPLYTAPPARKPLTDEQIDAEFDRECWVTVVFADGARGIALDKVTARDFARSIERAHGIIK